MKATVSTSLTKRQHLVLEFIKAELRMKGYPPSVREIGEAIGLSSSSTVHGHLCRLEEKGYLRRDPTKPRAIEVLDGESRAPGKQVINVPVLGHVAAGNPLLAQQQVEDHVPFPADFVQAPPDDLFLLTIQGDSMIEAGILHGDSVLVRRQHTAANGEIVVAMIEDEATVKRFYKESGRVRLQPENRFMDAIIVPTASILGKVVGLMRRWE